MCIVWAMRLSSLALNFDWQGATPRQNVSGSMMTASLIINSKSSRNETLADELLYVSKRHTDIRPYVLDGIDGLDNALDDIEKSKSDTLILCGGDGTLQATITNAINNKRHFGAMSNYVALPCGMTNVIANDCGLQGPPLTSLDNFLWRRGRGEIERVERTVISMQLSERQLPIYGFLLGAGLFHSAVEFSRQKVQSMGAKRTLALGLGSLGFVLKTAFENSGDEPPLPAQIRDANGELHQHDYSFMVMTTLTKLSAGVFPFWGDDNGPLKITTIDYPRSQLIWATLNVVLGRTPPWLKGAGYNSWSGGELRMRCDAPIVFDGEIYHANPEEDLIFGTSEKAAFLV